MTNQAHALQVHPPYVKIYLTLVVLAAVSVLGPMVGLPILTLITAFGIAAIKASMVAAYFMHLNIEKRYIWFLLFIMVTFLVVLFAGVAPDVMKHGGKNWTHVAEVNVPPASATH